MIVETNGVFALADNSCICGNQEEYINFFNIGCIAVCCYRSIIKGKRFGVTVPCHAVFRGDNAEFGREIYVHFFKSRIFKDVNLCAFVYGNSVVVTCQINVKVCVAVVDGAVRRGRIFHAVNVHIRAVRIRNFRKINGDSAYGYGVFVFCKISVKTCIAVESGVIRCGIFHAVNVHVRTVRVRDYHRINGISAFVCRSDRKGGFYRAARYFESCAG